MLGQEASKIGVADELITFPYFLPVTDHMGGIRVFSSSSSAAAAIAAAAVAADIAAVVTVACRGASWLRGIIVRGYGCWINLCQAAERGKELVP